MEPTYTYPALHPSTARNLLGSVVLLPVCLYYCYGVFGGGDTVIDAVSLMLREAGRNLGSIAGGESGPLIGLVVFPLLLPMAAFLFFTFHRFIYGRQLFLFVLGQSMFEASGLVAENETGDWMLFMQHFGHPEFVPAIDHVLVLGGLFLIAGCLLLPFFEED